MRAQETTPESTPPPRSFDLLDLSLEQMETLRDLTGQTGDKTHPGSYEIYNEICDALEGCRV